MRSWGVKGLRLLKLNVDHDVHNFWNNIILKKTHGISLFVKLYI